ncbi:TIGR00730 family Rossman fold protein [Actinoplanes sp. TFC3]|uniref:LOG family protein n=1 Tax=Actinoplanes sp. TFC3 TaxID=1710355 RepID=UPI00083460C1|nr:TIGR00730 family Rossman fold protein [Actinoplanes sp. TFC3]
MAAICVFCASSNRIGAQHLDLATALGKALGPRGHSLVSGGGCVGMMGAVADGARAGGAHTLGIIPQSLVDLEVADTASDDLVVTSDMGARKNIMIERSDAFITLPGGLGTLDELFEVWTTATLDLHRKPIVILDPEGFYTGLWEWLNDITQTHFVRTSALAQVAVVTSIDAALDHIEEALR